jgi:two-component system, chemotaxis family, sensor kinase CheA
MDDLLREFLTETSESLDTVDNQLVKFEQDPSDAKILDNIFRLVHTIKGTCGFLGLPPSAGGRPASTITSPSSTVRA